MGEKYDFSGWATKNDLLCSDGRTIRKDAFKECDGITVPLVWQHDHSSPENVLGHCLLENREDGVYTYGKFNDTDMGEKAKSLVCNGDIDHLSIYANKLKQKGGDVLHGAIREVSLVLAGANPGALIDTPILEHGDGAELIEDEAIIYTEEPLNVDDSLDHADTKEDGDGEEKSPEGGSKEGEKKMADEKKDDRTVQDVFDEFTDEQKNVVYFMIGEALKEAGVDVEGGEEAAQDAFEEGEEMKHNVFDEETNNRENMLSHSDMEEIFKAGKRLGSLKEAVAQSDVLKHDGDDDEDEVTYGIRGMEDVLFPDAKLAGDNPNVISRDMTWVGDFIRSCHHSPFSRVKSIAADLTADEARAKGYIKAHQKVEEVITMFKRKVEPQTIYKKQKFDRDDLLDITDFNTVAFIKTEMRQMLDEEIARACLVGDGRLPGAEDKINPLHIIPIYSDSNVYSIQVEVDATGGDKAKEFIDACVRARKDYKGSGNPTCYMTEDMLTECLLLEDGINHKLYKSEAEVATAIRVSRIVTVPVMENVTGTHGELAAIIVNPVDYTIGADQGGSVAMFEDFDIDYNQQKYLMETRISGALTKPYSALVVSVKEA